MINIHSRFLLAAVRYHPSSRLGDDLWMLALLALAWLVLRMVPYVLGPIALYRMPIRVFNLKMRLAAPDEVLDRDVQEVIAELEHALHGMGFTPPQRIATSTDSPLAGVESLLEHVEHGDLANAVAMVDTRRNAPARVMSVVNFRTCFQDGTILQTTNATLRGQWPHEPSHRYVVFSDVRDPVELYRLHRARVTRKSATVAMKPATRGTSPEQRLAFATRVALDTNNFLMKAGYRKRSPEGIRLTAKGATFGAWRTLFPWKQLLERERRRAAAEVMRLA